MTETERPDEQDITAHRDAYIAGGNQYFYGATGPAQPPLSGDSRDSPIIITSTVISRPERTKWGLLGNTSIKILVETPGTQAMVLHGIRPIVLSRQPSYEPWCQAALHVRGFDVDLDTDPPTVRPERSGFDPRRSIFPSL